MRGVDLEMARAGDDAAFSAIEREYHGLLRFVAKDYYVQGGDHADLMQAARIGLWKAVHDFREGGGASFRSFVRLCVLREVITAVKTGSREKHRMLNEAISFEHPTNGDGDGDGTIGELIRSAEMEPDEQITLRDTVDAIYASLEMLTDVERDSIKMVLIDCASYEVAAAALGMRPKAVDNAIQRGRRKLAAVRDAA